MNPSFDHSVPQMVSDFRMAQILNESLDNIRLIQSIENVFNAGDPVTATALARVFRQHDWDLRCKARRDELARARWWASGWARSVQREIDLCPDYAFVTSIRLRLESATKRILAATDPNP